MKKFVAILSIVLVVSATWLYLRQHYRNKSITAWQLVHKNALLVYESERAIPAWNDFIKLPVWPILSQIPSIDSINLQLKTIDSLTGRSGELETLLRDRPFLVSLNKISPNRLDYVLFIPLDNSDKIKILNDLILKFRNLPGHSFNTRHYENTDVFEIKNKAESSIFTYFFHKNYFVGSFTPYLVEDVVRNAAARYAESFQSAYGPVLNYPTIKGDDGNLYFNPHELPGLVTTFTDPVLAGEFRNLVSFSGPGYFDINFENNRFLFNGTTLASTDTAATFLSTFVDQPSSRLSSFYLMPSNTASLIDFTFANLTDWRRSVDRYWAKTGNPYLKRKTDFLSRYNILEKDFYNYAGHELALVNLETGDAQNTDKLILLQANDTSRLLDFMDNLTQTINKTSGDTLFYEKFGNYKIRQLPLKDFPSFLFGDLFTGFENSFYTLYKNYLVTGNSLKAVESFLGDAEEENTWGKSVSFAQYFDNVQKNANISLFVNLNREYGPLYNSLDKKWKDLFRKYEQLIRQFEILSIQFVNINNTIYCSFALQHRTSTTLIQRPSEFLADQLVAAGSVLAARPYIVTNHLDGSR